MQTCIYINLTGVTRAVSYQLVNNGTIPQWLRFQDNGNGTATFMGVPPPSASNYSVPVTVTVNVAGAQPANYVFTINVSALPEFLVDDSLNLCYLSQRI